MRQYGDNEVLFSESEVVRAKSNTYFRPQQEKGLTYTGPSSRELSINEFDEPHQVTGVDAPEKFVRNLQINFGPQHPAAHGVLRWESKLKRRTSLTTTLGIICDHDHLRP